MRGAGIEYLPGGYTNRNYRLDIDGVSYALRLVEPGVRASAFERRYLDIASAPDAVAYNADTGHLVTRWIEGPVIADAPPTPAEAGTYLAELHAQIPHGIRRYDFGAEIGALFSRARRTVDAAVEARFRALGWYAAEWRGCHNDLNPWNVIREPSGRFRTLDWEMAGDNDRLFDLVGLCLGLGWGMTDTLACIEASNAAGNALSCPPGRLRDTICAYRIREYAWAIAQIAGGNDRSEIRQQAATMRELLINAA